MDYDDLVKDIFYNYYQTIHQIQTTFVNTFDVPTKNSTFIKWYREHYYKTNRNFLRKTFDNLRKKFYTLPLQKQFQIIINVWTYKPAIHEITNHEELEHSIEDLIEITNGWTLKYGDTFSFEEVKKAFYNDTLLRGRKSVYGRGDILYSLYAYFRENFRNYILNKIYKSEAINIKINNSFDIDKYFATKNLLYLLNKKSYKPIITKLIFDANTGITYPPCFYTEGPIIYLSYGDLPYEMLPKLNYIVKPLQERRRIIQSTFRVKFY